MKKFRSLLAIVLILTCLLSLLVACGDKIPDKEDYATQPTDSDADETKNHPLTEKDKENIFNKAMTYLKAKDFDAAYDELVKIPDYQAENNVPVADYLARFKTTYNIVYIFDDGKADYTWTHTYTHDDYGFQTAFLVRNSQQQEQNKQTVRDTYENGKLVSSRNYTSTVVYTYDEETGLLIQTENHRGHGNNIDAITNFIYDETNRLIAEVVTDLGNKVLSTVDYVYDAKGLLIKKINTAIDGETQTAVETTYTYNQQGQKLTEKGIDEIGAYTITYTYNEKGQLVKEVLAHADSTLGYSSVYTYDAEFDRLYTMEKTITEMVTDKDTNETAPATRKETHFYEKYELYYNPYI